MMENTNRNCCRWLTVGVLLAAVAVGMGAFGAHGLESAIESSVEDPKKNLGYWETASRYQIYHSIAICMTGIFSAIFGRRIVFDTAATLFVIGIILFSGLLYVFAISDLKILGAIVPLGGLSLILGWLSLAVGFISLSTNSISGTTIE